MNHRKSFTLLEAVVATFILMSTVVSAMEVVQKSLSVTPILKEQLIASTLAQEGIELVRNLRDSNYIRNVSDPSCAPDANSCNTRGMIPQCSGASGCRISWNDSTEVGNLWDYTTVGHDTQFVDCATDGLLGGVCPELRIDPVTGFYGYGPAAWIPSGFTRTIRVNNTTLPNRQPINNGAIFGLWTPVLQDIVVTSSVTWQSRFVGLKTFTLRTILTNHLK